MSYYLAIDIGASSGRHMLGHIEGGHLVLEEVYRFENKLENRSGRLCWDTQGLFRHIVAGIKRCGDLGKAPKSIGIDTWAVDYVLSDGDGEIIGDAVAYRDSRTDGVRDEVGRIIPPLELYEKTGIYPQPFNTIYQLYTQTEEQRAAKHLLFIPEYFAYLLTGKMMCEYTVASTSGLLNCGTGDWDEDIIKALGYNRGLFKEVGQPGCTVGPLSDEIEKLTGVSAEVVLTCLHDTASAVAAVPSDGDCIYISSGTWSLMGTVLDHPIVSKESLESGFTNEGGYDGRVRYLKNIMGLWMIQSVKAELGGKYSFNDLCDMAMDEESFETVVDVNDQIFLAPESMIGAVKEYCASCALRTPENLGQVMQCIYRSLAKSYGETVRDLEKLTGKTYDAVHIVGGGSKDSYLNRLTAAATGKKIVTGPTEATAIGNLAVQMISGGEIESLAQAKKIIAGSFDIVTIN